MLLRTPLRLMTAITLLAGCYEGTTGVDYTKNQARRHGGRSPDTGDDLCEMNRWYDDGVCDMFCPEPDDECSHCPDGSDDVWYATTDVEECHVLDFVCPDGAEQFSNDCGCGCTGVEPPPSCMPVLCEIDCEYGFETNEHGCEVCSCNPPPSTCGPVCEIYCEYGHQRDDNGCEICACNPAPTCPDVLCDIACEHGFQTDDNGCATCACNPPPQTCGPVCDLYCEFGHQVDDSGCELCACNPAPVCDAVDCDLACAHGFLTDEHGCEICECNPAPMCRIMDARMVGGCEPAPRYIFNGAECIGESGCECVGEDCDQTFDSLAACQAATESCDCPQPSDPRVSYAGSSPEECAVIDFACPDNADYFGGQCGCGCITR